MDICKLLMPYVFVLLMVLAFGGLLINKYFYKRLKIDYPDVYKLLGEPSLFLNHSIKNSILVNKFIWKRQYLNLSGERFKKFCDFLLIYGIVIWIVLLTLVITMIFCLF